MNYNENGIILTNDDQQGLSKHIAATFGWMFIGLAVSTLVGLFLVYNINLLVDIYTNAAVYLVISLIGPIIIVIGFGTSVYRLNAGMAKFLFLLYAALLGCTFGVVLAVFELNDVIFSLGITSFSFGAMALLGYYTKVDLSRFSTLFFVGLITLIVVSIVAALTGSGGLIILVSILGVILFLGITAYDIQKIKKNYYNNIGDHKALKVMSIYSAFNLYIDFIQIFFYVLRLVAMLKDN